MYRRGGKNCRFTTTGQKESENQALTTKQNVSQNVSTVIRRTKGEK